MPKLQGLVGGSGTMGSTILDAEETVNFIVEKAQSQNASNPEGALMPTPGLTLFATATEVVSRGFIYAADSRFLAVIGPEVFEIGVAGTVTERGAVALDGNPAIMVYNGPQGGQVGIAAGGNIYVFTLATNVL